MKKIIRGGRNLKMRISYSVYAWKSPKESAQFEMKKLPREKAEIIYRALTCDSTWNAVTLRKDEFLIPSGDFLISTPIRRYTSNSWGEYYKND